MKTLPKLPYLQNIVAHYRETHNAALGWRGFDKDFPDWLRQFGFKVPVEGDFLEFTDDFDERELMVFILRWA